MSHQYELTVNQIDRLQLLAMKGDAEAAYRLYLHYAFWVNDEAKASYWLEKAVELGHEMAKMHQKAAEESKRIDTTNVSVGQPVPNPFEAK